MLSYTDLKPGTYIVLDGAPCVVLHYDFVRQQQRKPVVKVKIRNLATNSTGERSFQASDKIEEAEIDRKKAKFLYANRGEFWFCSPKNPRERFSLNEEIVGGGANFLKSNEIFSLHYFKGKVIGLDLPPKVDLKVTEAEPAIRGNTVGNVTKQVKLETGLSLNVPLFINRGDVLRVNTETGEYVERISKAKE